MKVVCYSFITLFFLSACSVNLPESKVRGYRLDKLLYKDDFKTLSSDWVIETPPKKKSKVYAADNKLIIDVVGGATVWLNKKLSGNYLLEYKRKVLVGAGVNDRLSDFNQFWMATDSNNASVFTRSGVFEEYDSLSMYYIGMGGNTNSTTRFRKYFGDGRKPLLAEYLDKEHLLKANKEYLISLIVKDGLSEFYVDGVKYFSYKDEKPLKEGFFGFRTTASRHAVSDFKVYSLK